VTVADVLMTLRDLTTDRTAVASASEQAVISAVTYDSRRAMTGSVFVALRGLKADGAEFVPQASARGATLAVADVPRPEGQTTPWIEVTDARLALALLADAFYEHPSRRMPVVGVTGTNGKTTTAYLLASILDAAHLKSGLLGTVTYRLGGEEREASRTTPEAPDVQQLLDDMIRQGCKSAVMEVSSHALALKRVDGMRFAAAIFTNLTRDHLDFHEDMETYFRAKRRLFEMLPRDAPGVINLDDPRGASLVQICGRPVTFALTRAADVTPGPLAITLDGLEFDINTPRGVVPVQSRLVGRPNVSNILAAAATAMAMDLPLAAISAGVANLPGVPGRFEIVSSPTDEVTVVVDYAHTDDALRNLLETARPLAPKRLVTVFGCGGDRDKTKRPLMGMVAARLSDVVVITSDNPRSEEPLRIIDEIKRGIPAGSQSGRAPDIRTMVDRRDAIELAVNIAGAGDVVLVAGKGHEKYQQIGGRVLNSGGTDISCHALDRMCQSLDQGTIIEIWVDSDNKTTTGSPDLAGVDYVMQLVRGEINLYRWDGSDFTRRFGDPSAVTLTFSYQGGVTVRISAAELGNTKKFKFFVDVISGCTVDPVTQDLDCASALDDVAPGGGAGLYPYDVKLTPPTLVVKSLKPTPARPAAGRPFALRLVAARSGQSQPAHQAGNEQDRHHGRDDKKKEIVGRGDRGGGHERHGEREEKSAAGDAILDAALQGL